MEERVMLENRISKLIKEVEPDNPVEFLVGIISTLTSEDQLWAFVRHLEEKKGNK